MPFWSSFYHCCCTQLRGEQQIRRGTSFFLIHSGCSCCGRITHRESRRFLPSILPLLLHPPARRERRERAGDTLLFLSLWWWFSSSSLCNGRNAFLLCCFDSQNLFKVRREEDREAECCVCLRGGDSSLIWFQRLKHVPDINCNGPPPPSFSFYIWWAFKSCPFFFLLFLFFSLRDPFLPDISPTFIKKKSLSSQMANSNAHLYCSFP